MKHLFVFLLCAGVVGNTCAGEKPLAKKFAEVHEVLAPIQAAAASGDGAAKLVLFDVETSMEHSDYNLPSTRTQNALGSLVHNRHLSQTTKAALNAYGQEDLANIKSLLNN